MTVVAMMLDGGLTLDSEARDTVVIYQRTLCTLSLFGIAILGLFTPAVLRSTGKPGSVCIKCGNKQMASQGN